MAKLSAEQLTTAIAASIVATIVTRWLFNNVPALTRLTDPRQTV